MSGGTKLFDLSGRVGLVTGGSQGLGRAFAVGLAQHGAQVAVVDIDAAAGEESMREIRALSPDALFVRADVSEKDQVDDAFDRVVGKHGRLDIVVNNAGVWSLTPTLALTLGQWQHVLAVNLTGTFLCCQAAGRTMLPRRRGSIINISSISGVLGPKERVAYAASKHGILGLTKSLANEWASSGVRVNAIAPGAHKTRMTMVWRNDPELLRKHQLSKIPMGRLGDPDELIGALIYLASDASAM